MRGPFVNVTLAFWSDNKLGISSEDGLERNKDTLLSSSYGSYTRDDGSSIKDTTRSISGHSDGISKDSTKIIDSVVERLLNGLLKTNHEEDEDDFTMDNDTLIESTDIIGNITELAKNLTIGVNDTLPCWTTKLASNNCVWDNDSNYDLTNDSSIFLTDAEKPEKVYWALFLVVLPFLAVFGNILIILSVYKERSLQSLTNYFIVSLAFADLLVAAVVMPFAVYVLVSRPIHYIFTV